MRTPISPWPILSERPPIYASCMTISGGRTEQHVIIGLGELAAVIRIRRHSLSILTEYFKTLKSDTLLPPVNRTNKTPYIAQRTRRLDKREKGKISRCSVLSRSSSIVSKVK